ncbi:hypothetical protein BO70DRAFT_399719 [Aspergillus heteromorphus CBS 117.55]|uniref:Uncharacterized protein n=1 Tax=Aspergillus heteromorphus CBS 117.55 TaxID=1448321 RepID=A0A317V7X5_9EURO|nr:uncharacterized protein BO70DRAFT_399719 [Aspergillus heteromorphus CBS 117.55]PWY70474.1 hypothetical protein BO70DRAFT_399719 [Aspergillus heteromorphus CBS 117.55]
MCITLTTKYSTCGCIWDNISTRCRGLRPCHRQEMITLEDLMKTTCQRCQITSERTERLAALIEMMEDSVIDDSGMVVEEEEEEEVVVDAEEERLGLGGGGGGLIVMGRLGSGEDRWGVEGEG